MKVLVLILVTFLLTVNVLYSQVISNFSVDLEIICEGATVNFTDKSIGVTAPVTDWLWDFGDGNASNEQNPSHTYINPGLYTVSLRASNSTGSTLSYKPSLIKVRETPIIALTYLKSKEHPYYMAVLNGVVVNADTLAYNYNWYFSQVSYIDTIPNIYYMFNKVGTHSFSFIAIAADNCEAMIDTSIVIIDELAIPNVFSPNDDGINDYFTIRTDGVTEYEFTVFNRFGAVMFTVSAKRIFWDGRTSAGELLPPGSYYYTFKSITNNSVDKAGSIYLAR